MDKALELLQDKEFLTKQRSKVVGHLRKKIAKSGFTEENATDAFYQGIKEMHNAILEGRFTMRDKNSFSKYLQTTCLNQYCKMFGEQWRIVPVDSKEEWSFPQFLGSTGDESPKQHEADLELMEHILMTLPEPCETLIYGRFWNKFSAAEMAERLEYKNSRVAITTLSRCMKKLTKRFNKERRLIDEY